jgi:5,10-methylenetetrahydrofolate reductase
MNRQASLSAHLFNPTHCVTLYGATPPRATASTEQIDRAAERLAERARNLPIHGLVVYDVQDESERTTEPRPFPFLPTIESRGFARMLQELSGIDTICYKVVGAFTENEWQDWLSSSADYGLNYLSLVGVSTPIPPPGTLPIGRALQVAASHPAGFILGGVVIAERHTPEMDESRRLLAKAAQGCRYFISQVVYAAEASIRLLHDYRRDCRNEGVTPSPIILTFSPCGRQKTMAFLKWLGVAMPPATEQAIMSDPAPFSRSIRICRDNLRAILDQDYLREVPIGINIESVSIHRDEIEASIELVHALQETAAEYGLMSDTVSTR